MRVLIGVLFHVPPRIAAGVKLGQRGRAPCGDEGLPRDSSLGVQKKCQAIAPTGKSGLEIEPLQNDVVI